MLSQTNTEANFQLTPGQRSLPDPIPQDEYIYIPEGKTNDPLPNLDLNTNPPSSKLDIPPLNPRVDKFLIDKEPIEFVSPPKRPIFSSTDNNKGVQPNQYPVDGPDKEIVLMPQEKNFIKTPTNVSGAEGDPSIVSTYKKPNIPMSTPQSTFLIEKTVPQYIPVDIPSEMQNENPSTEDTHSHPSEVVTRSPNDDIVLDNPSHIDMTSRSDKVIEQPTVSGIKFISALGAGIYVQIISYNNFPPTDILMQNRIISNARMKGKLKIYKAVHSKYYRVLIGPLAPSEVGIELLQWRKNGFDDAYVVYGNR